MCRRNNNSTFVTKTIVGYKAEGKFKSNPGKAGELWDETAAVADKGMQIITSKFNKAFDEFIMVKTVDDVSNQLSKKSSVLTVKAEKPHD